MRNRNGRRRTRNGGLAAALALVALAGAAGGCSGSKTPHKGQAAELFKWDVDDTAARRKLPSDVVSALYSLNIDATGIAYGPDGRLYVMTGYLLRFDADRAMHATDISGGKSVDWQNYGLDAEPGGTFLTVRGADVLRWRPDGTSQVVAAFAGTDRRAGTAVPASAPVGAVHAGYAPRLAGVRPDGSLVLVDSDVVWSLKDGRLTRLLQLPASGDKENPNTLMEGGAVNRSGTIWTASGPLHVPTLAGLRTVAPDGTVSRPALPARAEGVSEKPASLLVGWLADDGADGVYAHVYSPGNEYVLHVRPGSARAVAKNIHYPSLDCTMPHHPVDAMSMPCKIPGKLIYHAGHLVAAGGADYVLTLPLS